MLRSTTGEYGPGWRETEATRVCTQLQAPATQNLCCCSAAAVVQPSPNTARYTPWVSIPTGLCEVPARGHTQLQGEVLQEHGQDVADQDDKQQAVAKLGATRQASRPIAWIPAIAGRAASESQHRCHIKVGCRGTLASMSRTLQLKLTANITTLCRTYCITGCC